MTGCHRQVAVVIHSSKDSLAQLQHGVVLMRFCVIKAHHVLQLSSLQHRCELQQTLVLLVGFFEPHMVALNQAVQCSTRHSAYQVVF